jgi:hypothetical protein
MIKPTKEQYTQYWVYQQGKVIEQGYGAAPAKYKGYAIETKFYEEQYSKALADYSRVAKELKAELSKVGLDNPTFIDYGTKILEADTPAKVAAFLKEALNPMSAFGNFDAIFKEFDDLWKK